MSELGDLLMRGMPQRRRQAAACNAYARPADGGGDSVYVNDPSERRPLPIVDISPVGPSSTLPMVIAPSPVLTPAPAEQGFHLLLVLLFIIAAIVVVGVALYQLFSIAGALGRIEAKLATKA